MIKIFIPFLAPILLALGFWQIFSRPKSIFVVVILAVLLIWLVGSILAKRRFWQFFRLWINLSLVYIAQVLFSILLTSDTLRYWLAVVWMIVWGVILWLLRSYFAKLKNINNLDYLSFNRFLYYLGFWLLATSLYYFVIFINFSLLYTIIILLLAIYLWGREIMIFADEPINKYFIWLVVFTSAQVLLVLYLLPISFFMAGTIATLWFFFIMDFTISRTKYFVRYLGIFLATILVLLITSII